VDAVLICNTYHEFNNPGRTLSQIYQSLRPGGRIVIVDRAPSSTEAAHAHEIPLTVVDGELRQQGFEIVSFDDHFIERPGDDLWWLLIGRRP
jgi:SAM-dependent methyltransferase